MKLVLCTIVAASATDTLEKMADHINSLGASWTAAAPSRFGDFEDVKQVLGTILKGQPGYTEEGLESKSYEGENVDVPADFDVRTAFPNCASVSGNIRDQSSCGSCWAFGSTEAFNDRHCIATGDTTKFSVEDTTANCGFLQCFSMGCNGGQPGQAWNWFKKTGVVTGGDYTDIGAGDSCAPYSLAPCAHHVPATAEYPACPSSEYPTPSLSKCTESSYSKAYKDDKIKATGSYSLSGIQNIQADMVKYGSATAAFTVYSDFPTYKSGVYKHTSGSQLGGHAVKLLGWGTENGEDYWLVANSWNNQWGDHGTFKIARGNNECGIEGQVSAGTAGSTLESSASSLTLTFKDCGAKHATTKDIQPKTLELGADTAITGIGSLDKEVSGGTYDMELKAGGGLIDSHFTGNNCEAKEFTLPLGLGTLSWDGISCPLAAADSVDIGFHTKLAASLPPSLATSDIHLGANDQDGESLLCVDIHLAAQTKVLV